MTYSVTRLGYDVLTFSECAMLLRYASLADGEIGFVSAYKEYGIQCIPGRCSGR